jgi:hypothetical protein
MARPIKRGLDYFSHDTDAHADIKIKKLMVRFGIAGYGIYFYLLELIYRSSDYCVKLDDDVENLFAKEMNVDKVFLQEVIQKCAELELFDCGKLSKKCVLTSDGIAKRARIIEEKRTFERNKKATKFSSGKTQGKQGENPTETQGKQAETQGKTHKGKESKGKERIIEDEEDFITTNTSNNTPRDEKKVKLVIGKLFNGFIQKDFLKNSDRESAYELGWLICDYFTESEIEFLKDYEFADLQSKMYFIRKAENKEHYLRTCLSEIRDKRIGGEV